MKENFDTCFELLLMHEGGYVNDPRDRGGMTNLGVTRRALEKWLGSSVSEEKMRGLTPELVKPFYRSEYWNKIKGDDLPLGVDWSVFDWAVNSGNSRPVKALQHIIGATEDGILGSRTLAKLEEFDPKEVIVDMYATRKAFYNGLAGFQTFGKGWARRNEETMHQALEMIIDANVKGSD
jgi:lysozyme family protein